MTVEMRKKPKNKQSTSRSNGQLSSKKTNASTNINIAAADSTPQRRSRLMTELRMTPAVRIDNQFDTPTADDDDGSNQDADVEFGGLDADFEFIDANEELIGESELLEGYLPDSSYNPTTMEEDGLYPNQQDGLYPNQLQWKYEDLPENGLEEDIYRYEALHPETGSSLVNDKCHQLRASIQSLNEHARRAFILGHTKGRKSTKTHEEPKLAYFDNSSPMISNLVNKAWFSWYPCYQYIIYDNGSKFKRHFKVICESFGITSKLNSIKNPQANAILEQVHQVISCMLQTAEIHMAPSIEPSDIHTFVMNVTWAICSTYHTVLKASPGAVIFGRDMMFSIPFWLTGRKLNKQTKTRNGKIAHVMIGTTKLVI
eukprot:CCRYP_019741-RA/>CCRYP_019741-RA protein AED:0.59 eAED:0.51 QI:0/0/0/0.33/0/0.33/3/0/370